MRAFPCLSAVYSAWAARLRSAGVEILLQHEVTLVKRTKDNVTLQWRLIDHVDEEGVSRGIGDAGEANFDEVVFCCDADTCLKLLGESATWMERKVLGNVKVSMAMSCSIGRLLVLLSTCGIFPLLTQTKSTWRR